MIAQVVGIVALAFIVSSYQRRSRSGILICIFIGCVLFAVHFMLLGAFTGAVLNLLVACQALLFSRYHAKQRPKWPVFLMIGSFLVGTAATWQGVMSILPAVGSMMSTLGFWQRDPQHIRLFSLSARPLWLLYDFLSGSIGGVVTELLSATSITIGLWRHRNKSRRGVSKKRHKRYNRAYARELPIRSRY